MAPKHSIEEPDIKHDFQGSVGNQTCGTCGVRATDKNAEDTCWKKVSGQPGGAHEQ